MTNATTIEAAILAHIETTCPGCAVTVYPDDIVVSHDGHALVCARCAEPGADLPDASAWVVCLDRVEVAQ